jgi:AcrR family transcriptional regulator
MSGKYPDQPPRIDRRVARTRHVLHEALMRLIIRKDYGSITVQDLLNEANIGRSTFYAHYAGKDELLRKGFERLRDELRTAQRRSRDVLSGVPLAFSSTMFAHAEQYKANYRAMLGTQGGAIVLAEVRKVLLELVEPDVRALPSEGLPKELIGRFLVDSFHTVLSWWLERRPDLPAERAHEMFQMLVLPSLKSAQV